MLSISPLNLCSGVTNGGWAAGGEQLEHNHPMNKILKKC